MPEYNARLKKIYDCIFEKIYPQVEGKKYGVLYHVIKIILKKEVQQFNEVCKEFNIKDYDYYQDDCKTLKNIVIPEEEALFRLQIILHRELNFPGFEIEEERIMKKWIILTACLLVGVYACKKYLEQNQRQEPRRRQRDTNDDKLETVIPAPPRPFVTAALCLVVPASVTDNLMEYSEINVCQIEKLIDKASYLLCSKPEEAEFLKLEFTDENISNIGENREVFIKINISNTQDMIGKTLPHILKRNLPSSSNGKVIALAPLKNLSGLEQFYCI
jgi:hypothetical protein